MLKIASVSAQPLTVEYKLHIGCLMLLKFLRFLVTTLIVSHQRFLFKNLGVGHLSEMISIRQCRF